MTLSRQEQETVINFNEEEKNVSIYTASLLEKRRLIQKGFKLNENIKGKWEFVAPKSDFRYGLKRKRLVTESQRQEMKVRAMNNFKSKNSN